MSLDPLIQSMRDGPASRFFLVAYLPTAAAGLFLFTLVRAGAPGHELRFQQVWRTSSAEPGFGAVLMVAVVTVLAALLVHPLQLALVRLLEGQWPRWLAPLAVPLRRWHRHRRDRLTALEERLPAGPDEPGYAQAVQDAGRAGTLRRRLYPSGLPRPTALGNILAAAEETAGADYGWDAVVAWPRLYPLLPGPTRTIVDARRNSLDFAATMTATATATAIAAALLLCPSPRWLPLALVPLGVGFLAWRGALQAALAYGEAVRVAFDLHRFELHTALRLPLPATRADEIAAARGLCDLWRQGVPVALTYQHPPT
ncbi:hypothetical protein [Dactylosporangium sp. NPDC000521]|uniref:hypothetical protein n=1 Tax=Dactylosporangium sp. NPDC000521 TaxID=3363975 RepID=UPI003691D50A